MALHCRYPCDRLKKSKESLTPDTTFRRTERAHVPSFLARGTAMNEETLFEEALSRSPEERAAFLDQACAGRPELRAAVEALLAAHEKSGNILDRPAGPDRGFRTWPGPTRRHPRRRRLPSQTTHRATSTEDRRLRPDVRARHRHRGPVYAAREDRRRGHGRGLGRQADRAGQAQGGAQADQDRHGFAKRCSSASSRSGRRWR